MERLRLFLACLRDRLPQTSTGRWLLWGTVICGLMLRMVGLRWGLPSARHYFSYHPDEITIVSAALRIDPATWQWNPDFFRYGSLYIYLVAIAKAWLQGVGILDSGNTVHMLAQLHVAARCISAAMGTATILLAYRLGRIAGGRESVGLLSAFLVAVTPGLTAQSHFATVDVTLTFFTTAALLSAFGLLEALTVWTVVRTGLLIGLAAATKYGAALLLLSLWATAIVGSRRKMASGWVPLALRYCGIGLAAAVGGFLLGCPYSVLSYHRFAADFLAEWQHVQTGHGYVFVDTGNGLLYHLRSSFPVGMGLPLAVVGLAGMVWAALRRSDFTWVAGVWWLCFLFVLGRAEVRFLRYTLPLFPVCAVAAAWLLCSETAAPSGLRSRLAKAVALLVCLYTVGYAARFDTVFFGPDPRDRAADWMQSHIPAGSTVALLRDPWFYTPPFQPFNGGPLTRQQFADWQQQSLWHVVITNWQPNLLPTKAPSFLVASEFETADVLRLLHAERYGMRLPVALPTGAARFWQMVQKDYKVCASFAKRPFPFSQQHPPHDWLYPNPTITIYERVASAAAGP